jgi:peptide methionine sulfoxide reductase MsrA
MAMQNSTRTEVATLAGGCFWCLEAVYTGLRGYHQNYFEPNAYPPYCQIVIAPKMAKVRERYLARLKRA